MIQFLLQYLITKIKEPNPHTVTCNAFIYTEENELDEMFCFVSLKLMKIITSLTDIAVFYCHKFISFSVESSLTKDHHSIPCYHGTQKIVMFTKANS